MKLTDHVLSYPRFKKTNLRKKNGNSFFDAWDKEFGLKPIVLKEQQCVM